MILAGDVGGTKVHLALYNFDSGKLKIIREHKYPAHEFASLDDVANDFLSKEDLDRSEVKAACFGCPGPVRDGRIKLTNLPWAPRHSRTGQIALDRAYLPDQRS